MSEEAARVALVSGGNRGLGREIARQLAARGLRVLIGARDKEAGRLVAAEIGAAGAYQLDVRDQVSVDQLVRSIESAYGRLDVLVNNAGILPDAGAPGVGADLDAIKAALNTNLVGAWRLANACIPLMQRGGYGRIVNLSSTMGQLTDMQGSTPAYRVSKTALNAMTRILAVELEGTGILVNSACPGWVRTDMGTARAPRSVEEGADTPLWLATLPDDGPTSGFFRDRQPLPW